MAQGPNPCRWMEKGTPVSLNISSLQTRRTHWEHISLIYLKYMSDILIWPYQALIRLIFHITTDIRYQPDIRPSRRRIRLIPGP